MSLDQNLWYVVKAIVTKNARVKYEIPTYTAYKVIAKVNVFVHADADADTGP